MSTAVLKAWASVAPQKNEALVTIQYTGEGKIDTLTRRAMRAINESAGVAVRRYRSATFKEWGVTQWAHETGAPYNQTTCIYSMK